MNNEEDTIPEEDDEDSAYDRITNETNDSPPTEMIKGGAGKDKD